MGHPVERRLRLRAMREELRESLATACVLGLLAGALIGAALGRIGGPQLIDAGIDQQLTIATTLLSAVVTVVGVVLSVLVLAQQLASQQYSPRAIRTSLRNRPTQTMLALLFGYLGYMLGVIQAVGGPAEHPLGLPVGMLLSVAALGVVAALIQHVTEGFRADQLVARIGHDTTAAVRRIAERDAHDRSKAGPHQADEVPDDAQVLHAPTSGYLQDVAVADLSRLLHDRGMHVRLTTAVGDFVGEGTGIGHAWSTTGGDVDGDAVQDLVGRHLRFGPSRTTEREIGSGVQQLVDVALKALSPAVNDPHTAVQSVNTLTRVLQQVAERRQEWLVGTVDDEVVLTVPRPLLWDFARYAVSSVRRVAGRYPEVLHALVMLLRTIAATRPEESREVRFHLDALELEAERGGLQEVDLEPIRQVVARARTEIAGGEADQPQEPDEHSPDPVAMAPTADR